ncbi:MAG: hypothetical protein RL095_1377 [Verrucomicrobiota bacterium]|jgi:hypothetical protein
MKRKTLTLAATVSQGLLRPLFNKMRSDLNAAKAMPPPEPETLRKAGSATLGPGKRK